MYVPFGLAAVLLNGKEIGITEFTEDGFRIRMRGACPEVDTLRICFYDLEQNRYQEVLLTEYEMRRDVCKPGRQPDETVAEPVRLKLPERPAVFYTECEIHTAQASYQAALQRLIRQYGRYVYLKLEEGDGALAKALTGYPEELDELHFDSLAAQRRCWFGGKTRSMGAALTARLEAGTLEYALALDHAGLYRAYLREPILSFLQSYECIYGSLFTELSGRIPDRLYIGNACCPQLFPHREQLFAILEKAKAEQLQVTLEFSTMRAEREDAAARLLGQVAEWCERSGQRLEVTVNDWALAGILKEHRPWLSPCLGILLNKRKKDPRMEWKQGDRSLLSRNSLNAAFYRDFLNTEYGICRYEWETCGYEQELPEGQNSLHLPFYQTNTSSYCLLHAIESYGMRGRQEPFGACHQECEGQALLYPAHLNMVGRYNSLFALDCGVLEHPESRVTDKVNRIVVGLL